MHWIQFLGGLFLGFVIGFLLCALLAATKEGSDDHDTC